MAFRGIYYHSIDDKGRIIFPAKLRETFAEKSETKKMFVTHWKGHLKCYPEDEWRILEEKVGHQSVFKEEVIRFQRLFMSPAVECTFDSQGRILVPPSLRGLAKLDKDIVLAGMVRIVEIWSKERWEEEINQSSAEFDKYSNYIADLGI